MNKYQYALLGALMSSVSLTGCVTTGISIGSTVTPQADTKPYKPDVFGTTTAAFIKGQVTKKADFYYTPNIPYSFRKPGLQSFTYESILYSTYITPDPYPNGLIFDDSDDAMFVVESGAANKKIATTMALTANKPSVIGSTISKLATNPNYRIDLEGREVGYSNNVIKNQKQPFERTRYLLMAQNEPTTVSEIRDDLMANFYGVDHVQTTSGIKSKFRQKFFYIDVITWSDVSNKSKYHTAFLLHGMPKLKQEEEAQWLRSREDYLTAFNMMQF